MFRLATVLIGSLVAIGIMGASDGRARLRDPHVRGTELWLQTSAKSLTASGGSLLSAANRNIRSISSAADRFEELNHVERSEVRPQHFGQTSPTGGWFSPTANRDVGSISSAADRFQRCHRSQLIWGGGPTCPEILREASTVTGCPIAVLGRQLGRSPVTYDTVADCTISTDSREAGAPTENIPRHITRRNNSYRSDGISESI
jgi:hypothetical protein